MRSIIYQLATLHYNGKSSKIIKSEKVRIAKDMEEQEHIQRDSGSSRDSVSGSDNELKTGIL